MTNVAFAYSEEENGWASDEILLTGSIVLEVSLKKKAFVVVKKRNGKDMENPKVYVTKIRGTLTLNITGEAEGKYIQILTGEEPNYIRYGNI